MAIKSFKDFITEELNHVRHKKVKHVEDHNPEDGKNKEAEVKAEEYLEDVKEDCPRCGEHVNDCQCEEDDPWSTQNYHRVPKGEEEKAKPKQEFKK
tara:strand:+ start:2333 stop:2620 length:288 start_codon:yes stop_codon:yes gene_type:complete